MTKSSDILCQSIDFHQINTFGCEKKKEYNLERRETWGQESCSYKHFFFIFHKLTKSRAARKFNRGKKMWTGLLIFPPSFLNRLLINFPKKPAGKITFKSLLFQWEALQHSPLISAIWPNNGQALYTPFFKWFDLFHVLAFQMSKAKTGNKEYSFFS